ASSVACTPCVLRTWPSPATPCCASRGARPASPPMPADLLEQLVSPRVGIVQSVAPQVRDRREPMPPYLYTATMAAFDFRKGEAAERTGAGKGLTRDAAIASALGEAVERYCAYQEDPARVFVSTGVEVGDGAVRPSDLVLYSAEQYARPRWPY